jgi:hypothetical protein
MRSTRSKRKRSRRSHAVYHNADECAIGREIPEEDRRDGNAAYTLCEDCAEA